MQGLEVREATWARRLKGLRDSSEGADRPWPFVRARPTQCFAFRDRFVASSFAAFLQHLSTKTKTGKNAQNLTKQRFGRTLPSVEPTRSPDEPDGKAKCPALIEKHCAAHSLVERAQVGGLGRGM